MLKNMEKSKIETFGGRMDPYKVLGVPYDASANQIKKRFTALSLENHPDKSAAESEEYKLITQAYDVLKDPGKRGAFDTELLLSCNSRLFKDPEPTDTKELPGNQAKITDFYSKIVALVFFVCLLVAISMWLTKTSSGVEIAAKNQNLHETTSTVQLEEMKHHFSALFTTLERRMLAKFDEQTTNNQNLDNKFDSILNQQQEMSMKLEFLSKKVESLSTSISLNSDEIIALKENTLNLISHHSHFDKDINSLKDLTGSVMDTNILFFANITSVLDHFSDKNMQSQIKLGDDFNHLVEQVDSLATKTSFADKSIEVLSEIGALREGVNYINQSINLTLENVKTISSAVFYISDYYVKNDSSFSDGFNQFGDEETEIYPRKTKDFIPNQNETVGGGINEMFSAIASVFVTAGIYTYRSYLF